MTDKKRVIIIIEDGIPEVIQAPDDIEVDIWDYDVLGYPEADLLDDADGRKYFLREG
jgi:hypothetical protein